MLGLIQRVRHASVVVDGRTVGEIDAGLLLFLGVEKEDDETKADALLKKVLAYRVFADAEGKMNLNVQQAGGGLLVVSQFTLAADTRKGLRPSFSNAGSPALAESLYEYFVHRARAPRPRCCGNFCGGHAGQPAERWAGHFYVVRLSGSGGWPGAQVFRPGLNPGVGLLE